MFRKSSATLLILAALQASGGLQAQEAPAPAASVVASSSPVAAQLLDLRSERAGLLRGIELQESEISRLRPLGDRAALRSAVAERNRLRGSLRAVNTSIRLLNSVAQAGGVQSPSASFDGAVQSLRSDLEKSGAAFREAQRQLEQARAGGSEAEIAKARRLVQNAALRLRVATHAVEQLESRREQIVAVVEQNASGVPRELAGAPIDNATPTDGSEDSVATGGSAAVMELIAAGASPVAEEAPPAPAPETLAPPQQVAAPVPQALPPVPQTAPPQQAAPEEPSLPIAEELSAPAGEVVAVVEPAPASEEPAAPADEPSAPVAEEPSVPAQEVAVVEEPVPAAEEPAAPVEEASTPLSEELPPTVEEAAAVEQPAAASEEPAAPLEELAGPVAEQPVPAVEEPAAPADESSVPAAEEPPVPAQEVAVVEEPVPAVEEPAAPVEEASTPLSEELPPTADEVAAIAEPVPPAEEPATPTDTDIDAVIADALLEDPANTPNDPATDAADETLPPTQEEVADSTPLPIVEEPPPVVTTDTASTPAVDTTPVTATNGDAVVTGEAGSGTSTSPAPEPEIAGYAVLRWTIPVTRANGAPLAIAELRGYEIYVISESTGERTVITIDDPLREEHRLDGLPPDTWHFAVAAIDTAGNPSELSAVVSKTIADTSVASNP